MLGKGSEEEEAVVKSLEGKPLRVQVGIQETWDFYGVFGMKWNGN